MSEEPRVVKRRFAIVILVCIAIALISQVPALFSSSSPLRCSYDYPFDGKYGPYPHIDYHTGQVCMPPGWTCKYYTQSFGESWSCWMSGNNP